MIGRFPASLRRYVFGPEMPAELRGPLAAPLFARVGSLMLGHAVVLVVWAIATFRTPGVWTVSLLAASIVIWAARILLFVRIRHCEPGDPVLLLRWKPRYYGIGLTWAAVNSAFCVLCLAARDDEPTWLLTIVLCVGMASGAASRNAGTPRFAVAQIGAWLLPLAFVGPLRGSWYWLVSALTLFYFVALCSIVRQHYRDLSSLLGAERAKDALASRFDAALSNMTQGLLLFDTDGRLQVANRQAADLLGLPPSSLHAGASATGVAEQCAALGIPHQWLLAGGAGNSTLDLPGGRAIAASRASTIDGRAVITFEDITERRRAELTLAKREAQLRAVFENAAAGVVELEVPSGRFVSTNPVFCRMVGRDAAELLGGLTSLDVSHPADRSAILARLQSARETGAAYEAEKRYVRPDGTEIWVSVSTSSIIVDGEGRPLRVVSIVHDITERKAAEAALRESEEMLRLSLGAGRIGSYRRDMVAGLIYCGPESREMHGFPAGGEPVSNAVWAAMVVPEDRERLRVEISHAYAARQAEVDLEYRIRHPSDNTVRHIETRTRVEYDPQGQPVRSIGVAIDITDRRQAEARIAHLAHHDPLTGLPNRALFRIRLDQALRRARRGEGFAVFCLDLDRFKEVNDALGHPVGDALLRAVTERVRAEIRDTDTIARLGGDEFAVIQSGMEQPGNATALGERLIRVLGAPFEVDGHHLVVGVSIGITISPADGLDPDQLLKNADMALYRAKAEGRGRLQFYEQGMTAEMQARRALEIDLRHALEVGEFELFYQPVVHIGSRQVSGFEALIRWRHPERGLVGPDQFIPLAESIGLILPIGTWVLEQACAEAVRWPRGTTVAVNLSVAQFASPTLVECVAETLRRSGLDAERLELEITETVMLQDTEAAILTLHRLKALGVRIALDDFGTGYSSLSYLQRFPFDKIKIDRAFVGNLGRSRESAAIIRAVIDLCAGLNMATTAEGVETAGQLQALAVYGCMSAQGYYFSRPRPAADLLALMQALNAAEPEEDLPSRDWPPSPAAKRDILLRDGARAA